MITVPFDIIELQIVLLELLVFHILVGKRLDHLLPQQTVLNSGIQLSHQNPLLTKHGTYLKIDFSADDQHKRDYEKNNQGQRYINTAQNDKGSHTLNTRNEKLFRTMMGKFRNIKQITGNPAHDLPYFCIAVVGVR